MTVSRGGRSVVAVVLGALDGGQREEVAAKLLEAGFDAPPGTAPAPGRTTLDGLSAPASSPEPVAA